MIYIPFRVKKIKINEKENKIIFSIFLFENKNDNNIENTLENNLNVSEENLNDVINPKDNIEYKKENIENDFRKYKEYIFDISSVKLIALGYIKEVEELKNREPGVIRLFKKAITLGMHGDKNEKIANIKEQIFMDIIIRENEQNYFFRVDLSFFDYKDFLKEEFAYSSFINMRRFFNKLLEIFHKELFDNNFHSFCEVNSLQKIQRYNTIYEFQDYVISKAKERGIL